MLVALLLNPAAVTDPLAWADLLGYWHPAPRRVLMLAILLAPSGLTGVLVWNVRTLAAGS